MSSEEQEELSPEELTALLSSFMPDIPGYRVMRRIGKGGMSQVYLGVQESLDRQVAIKVLAAECSDNPERRVRFEREAHAAATLSHPHICQIYEISDSRTASLTSTRISPSRSADLIRSQT